MFKYHAIVIRQFWSMVGMLQLVQLIFSLEWKFSQNFVLLHVCTLVASTLCYVLLHENLEIEHDMMPIKKNYQDFN
jgi:hypothetical protein